jgi:hypothetical protein
VNLQFFLIPKFDAYFFGKVETKFEVQMPLFGSTAGIDNVLHPLPILWHDGASHLD